LQNNTLAIVEEGLLEKESEALSERGVGMGALASRAMLGVDLASMSLADDDAGNNLVSLELLLRSE
jgi:hypothetical protein